MGEGKIGAVVGCGLIGRAWAIDFARGGWRVRLWDPVEGVVEQALAAIDRLLADLVENGLLQGEDRAAACARLEPAGGGEDRLRLRVGDARGEFRRGEAAEHHGMDGAEPRAGEHGDRRLRHHHRWQRQ